MSQNARIAACLIPIDRTKAESEIQVFPAGQFSVPHGAMRGSGPWQLDVAAAVAIIDKVKSRKNPLVIDYEHQSLMAATNGMPAPAAGWIDPAGLRWRSDSGMFAAAHWTDRAKGMIESGEYAYISPVFTYDKDGTPTDLLNLALTNNPAIDGMQPVLLAAASRFHPPTEDKPMPLHPAISALLGVAEDADDAAIVAACEATAAKLTPPTAEESTAATTATPDPAKFAPIAALTALQSELAALKSAQIARDIEDAIKPALADGRLLQAQEQWARDLGASNMAALRSYLETAQPIAALTGSQTGGKAPEGTETKKLTDEELAICSQLGLSADVFIKSKEAA